MYNIPFYYSFKEFEKNYQTDLENWLSIYEDADENFFIEILKQKYAFHKDYYELYYVDETYPEKEYVTLDIFTDHLISNLISLLERNVKIKDVHTKMFLANSTFRNDYGYGKGYYFNIDFLKEFKTICTKGVDYISNPHSFFENNEFSFLIGFIDTDLENMTLKPNYIKHNNYYYAQDKIQLFISNKMFLNAEKVLEEDAQIKIEARKEYQELVSKKIAKRKNKHFEEVIKIDENNIVYKTFIRSFFLENTKTVELFKYLVNNYDNPQKNSTEFTKYNHIYNLLKNEELIYVSKEMYIEVVKELFAFDITKGGYIKNVESSYINGPLKQKLVYFNSIK